MNYKCPLARLLPERIDTERVKRDGWINDGILVVDINDGRLGWDEKNILEHIGGRFYGERGGKG